MNNKYIVKMSAPLLRPGMSIETEVSKRYVVPTLYEMLELVREYNNPPQETK